ncbi:MAG: FG-GAP repeat domain-containing protein, partial [Methylocella sp.]
MIGKDRVAAGLAEGSGGSILKRILRASLLGAVLLGAALAVVFGCRGDACFTFFFHRGPALSWTLAAQGLPEDGMWKSTPVFADVNGDGFLDLAALPRLGNGAHVWLGDGKGAWRDASEGLGPPFSCGGGVAFGDVNNDGLLDLVVADHCAGAFVYLGDGRGHWKESTAALNPAASQHKPSAEGEDEENELLGAEDVAVGDVNEDGFMDLVVTLRLEGGIRVYFGDGSGKFWKEATDDGLPKSGWANNVLLQDIDGDGHLDVVASYYEGPRVWRGDGKGHFQPYSQGLPTSTAGGLYRGIAAGDVNEDGLLDIAVANILTGPEIYLQTKGGTWQPTPPLQSSIKGGATALALADLYGDGHLDLVVGGSQTVSDRYGLFVFRGNGKAEWTEVQGTNLPLKGLPFVWGVALADVNGDGMPDLAV